jgi:two-component system sensor histidine kinase AtoS
MKLRILIGLTVMLCCFFAGGLYIYQSVAALTTQLDELATFHRVEALREQLETRIRTLQLDLNQPDLHRSGSFDRLIADAEELSLAAGGCRACHHHEVVTGYLEQIDRQAQLYLKNISRNLTMRGDALRLDQLRAETYRQGEALLELTVELTKLSSVNADARAQLVRQSAEHTKQVIAVLLVVGPLGVLGLSGFFMQRFRGALLSLTRGANELERGNLNYRITDPLKDEFRQLAESFNSMATTLNREKQYTESVQKLYRALFESAQEAICIIETSPEERGKILSVNPAAAKLYGYSLEELKTMYCFDLSPASEMADFRQRLERMQKGSWLLASITRKRRDGSTFPAEINAGPMEIDGHPYILLFTRDITERVQAQKELLHANQLAVAGRMAVGLAHEIKNPLAGIKATVEVLSADLDLEPDDRELFERIVDEVERMERLLRNLLKFARPPQPQLEVIDLDHLLDYTLKNLQVTGVKSSPLDIVLRRDFDPQPVQMKADSSQLQQVLLNLYLNAIEAFEQDGEIITRTRVDREKGQVAIEIEDNGPGISAGVLENIFTPFFTTKNRGTGLGLPICQRLIEQHEGTIHVFSEPGHGTRFVITLPIIQQPQQQQEQEGEQHE